MKCRFFTALVALVLPLNVQASDFSKLADPALARTALLSKERRAEVMCATLAHLPYDTFEYIDVLDPSDQQAPDAAPPSDKPASSTPPPITYDILLDQAQADQLFQTVYSRLTSDLGSADFALNFMQTVRKAFTPHWDYSAENVAQRAKNRTEYALRCAQIFAAAKTDQLDTALSAASAAPLALPDVLTCLAYDHLARDLDGYRETSAVPDFDVKAQRMFYGPKGPKRKARMQAIAVHAATLDTMEPRTLLSRLMLPCLAVYAAEIKRQDPN